MRTWRGTRRVTVTGASSGCCSARHSARSISPMRSLSAIGAPSVFEHVIEVEAEAVAGRRDARVDDVEAELVEHRGGAGEAVVAMRREREDGGGAALAARLHRDQRVFAAGLAVGEQLRVPGDFLGRVPQEVRGGEALPGARDLRRGDAAAGGEQLARAVLRLAHELVLVDRALEAAAQRALHALVELLRTATPSTSSRASGFVPRTSATVSTYR